MLTAQYHTPVLLPDVLQYLFTSPTGTYVDATIGGAGHAEAIVQKLDGAGKLVGIDADTDALDFSRNRLAAYGDRALLVHQAFGNLKLALSRLGIESATGILFDLGVSSSQLDDPDKGFSFRSDQPLDMRMDRSRVLDAGTVVNTYEKDRLAEILERYGEERHARRIARRIITQRAHGGIRSTGQLAAIVEEAVGSRNLVKSLARVFQALRIEVNDELGQLRKALGESIELLSRGGRLVVISYHSLEDRIVKTVFREASATVLVSGTKLVPPEPVQPKLRLLTRKPVLASDAEVKANPRARSAKLRAAERCG